MLSEEISKHSLLLYHSFEHITGKKLLDKIDASASLSDALYKAPFVLLSHGTEADPVFNYANLTAQWLWELAWEQFTRMPSRFRPNLYLKLNGRLCWKKPKEKDLSIIIRVSEFPVLARNLLSKMPLYGIYTMTKGCTKGKQLLLMSGILFS